jgi:hypothetical protein
MGCFHPRESDNAFCVTNLESIFNGVSDRYHLLLASTFPTFTRQWRKETLI